MTWILSWHGASAMSEMAGLLRMAEGMRHKMQCAEDELIALSCHNRDADLS